MFRQRVHRLTVYTLFEDTSTSPDGQTMEADMPAGHTLYMDPVDHATENIGDTESLAILVELK